MAQATRLIRTIDCCVYISAGTLAAAGPVPSICRRRSPPEGSPRLGQELRVASGLGDGGHQRARLERHGRDVVEAMGFAQGEEPLGFGGESVDAGLGPALPPV